MHGTVSEGTISKGTVSEGTVSEGTPIIFLKVLAESESLENFYRRSLNLLTILRRFNVQPINFLG